MLFVKAIQDLLKSMYRIGDLRISLQFSEYNSPGGEVRLTLHSAPDMYTSTKLKALQRLIDRFFQWSKDGGAILFKDDLRSSPNANTTVNIKGVGATSDSDGFFTLYPHGNEKSVGDILLDLFGQNMDLSQVTIIFNPSYEILYTFANQLGNAAEKNYTIGGITS